jgi:hypothetical protein
LLSAAVLNYPSPVLINWGAVENKEDAYVQHLAKVWTILAYLDHLHETGKKDDLVLIVDGFDIYFQLPPEVILKRYFEENERADRRAEALVGKEKFKEHGIKQTVIFGHDKLCWPIDDRRPACWAVPQASDPPFAYGPYTDHGGPPQARARWLNSGTIIGPVNDVRDIFKDTLEMIHANHTTDSDQFYFQNLFAAQQYGRTLLEPEPFKGINKEDVDWPDVQPGQRTEYFLGLDYEAAMFQTMAFFRPYLSWMTFSGVPKPPKTHEKGLQKIIASDSYYEKILPDDVASARPPFYASTPGAVAPNLPPGVFADIKVPETNLPTHLTWRDLKLGVNVISNHIWPLLHFTGAKEFRELWWPNMWFVPYAEELLKASIRLPRHPIDKKPIGGKVWWPVEMKTEKMGTMNLGEKGGAWADNGTFLGWDGLCGVHEVVVFGKKD